MCPELRYHQKGPDYNISCKDVELSMEEDLRSDLFCPPCCIVTYGMESSGWYGD